MPSNFDEIRPFNNSDLPKVLGNLVNNQAVIRTLVAFRFSHWPSFTKPIIGYFIKRVIIKKIAQTKSLRDFQRIIEPYMQRMIAKTTTELSVSGLDTLDLSKPCLFISNHRDIALDPAFINWVLHINGQDTVRIAVGDNLLKTSWVADILRLNKCFVVQRAVKGRKEKLAAAKLLSQYIHHSLNVDKNHIWIAQREGRAKDGIDVTNPAIISMLSLNKPKSTDFADYIANLRIVPVSISYEFDPCDVIKAKSEHQREIQDSYSKPENEDMQSIVSGISGQKGRVHLHFGKLIGTQCTTAKEVSDIIDEEILSGYKIFPTTKIALSWLESPDASSISGENNPTDEDVDDTDETTKLSSHHTSKSLTQENAKNNQASIYLKSRLTQLNPHEQEKLLRMYANPLIQKRH